MIYVVHSIDLNKNVTTLQEAYQLHGLGFLSQGEARQGNVLKYEHNPESP